MDFFGDFRLPDTFQEQIALNLIEIDKNVLRTKFPALSKSRFSMFKETCT